MNVTASVRGHIRPVLLTVAAVTVAAVALTGCSNEPSTPSAGLSLASMSNASADSAMPMSAATRESRSGSGATLATPLPTGPSSGPIYVPSAAVDTAKVTALASALGITQAPVEQPGGWSAEIPSSDPAKVRRLTVLRDDVGTWFFGTGTECDLSVPNEGDSTCSSTAVAPVPDDTQPSVSCTRVVIPGEADTTWFRSEASSFFTTLGVAGKPVRTGENTNSCTESWSAQAVVGGLAVNGLDTTVTFAGGTAPSPTIPEAAGTLATWTPEGDYPLIDAQQGWNRVGERPMPAMAELCQVPPDDTGCLATKETMTGGEIGLMRDLNLSSDRVVLVPAWLFTVTSMLDDPDGGPAPVMDPTTSVIAVTAIADSALRPAATEPGVIGTASSEPGAGDSGGSSPGSPGSIGTAVPPNPADPPVPIGVPERMAGMEPGEPTPLPTN